MTNTEGGTDDEEFRNAAIVDRVTANLAVVQGRQEQIALELRRDRRRDA